MLFTEGLKNMADIDLVSFAAVLYGRREMDLMTSGSNYAWNLLCVDTTVLVCGKTAITKQPDWVA